jgi:hypothetical protein
LKIGGSVSGSVGTFTASTGTVEWNADGDQIVAGVTYYNLTLSGSGVKTLQTSTTTIGGDLTLSGTATATMVVGLAISGTLYIYTGATLSTSNSNYTLTAAYLNIAGGTLIANGSTITLTGTGTTPLFTNAGTFTAGTSTVIMNPNAGVTLTSGAIDFYNLTLSPTITVSRIYAFGAGAITIGNNLNITPNSSTTYALTVNMGNDITVTGTTTIARAGSYATSKLDAMSSNYNLSTGYLNIATGGTFDARNSTVTLTGSIGNLFTRTGTFTVGGSSTVNVQAGGSTTLNSGIIAFDNLTIDSPDNTITLGSSVTVADNLSIGDGTTFATASTYTLGVTGTTTVGGGASGTLTLDGTGSETFTGDVTVNSGGYWNETGVATYSFGGNLQNDGTFTANSGVHTFTGATKTFSGANTISIPSVTISGTYTNNGTLTVGTALSGGGGLTNGTAPTTAILNIGGTCSITTLSNAGTVAITGSGTISTALANFTNTGTINLNGSGTIAGITNNTAGIVNLSSSGTITSFNNAASTSTLNISASPVPTITTLTATATGNTVNYTGTNQTLKVTSYYNLILSGGAKTFGAITTINGNLTLSGSATATTGANLTVSGNLNIGDGTTLTIGAYTLGVTGTSTVGAGSSGTLAISSATGTKTFTGAVTINSGGAITESAAAPLSFGSHVTINGTLTEYGAATVGIAGSLTNNGTYTASTGTHSVGGNWSNSGTFTAGTSTIIFNSAGAQTINGDNTWYNLTVTASTARTVYFQSGATQTIGTGGSLTFTGASGQLLTLAPLTGGSAWNLTFNGATQNVLYVSVSWSNAGGGSTVYASNGTNTDGGNNTNWQFGAVTYYSQGSVVADMLTNWNTNRGGGGTSPSNFTYNDTFVIQTGHSMTTSAAWTLSGVNSKVQIESGGALTASAGNVNAYFFQVDSGGTMTVNGARTLTINNSTSDPDLIVNGTLVNSGTITLSSSTMSVGSTGTYRHAQNGGTIPTATWDVASTVEVTGVTTTAPSGVGQSFGNFTWNSTSQTATVSLAGLLITVNGNLIVASTGTGALELAYSEAFTLTIGGDLRVQTGNLYAAVMYSPSTPQYTLNINGDLIVQGGVLDFCHGSSSVGDSSNPIINLGGNYNQSGGTVTAYAGITSPYALPFNFTGANKTFTKTAGTFTGHYMAFHVANGASLTLNNSFQVGTNASYDLLTVDSGGTLNAGSYADSKYVFGSGKFTVASGGTLGIGDPYGILTGTGTGSTSGSIQVTGTRTYNAGANYIYNGSAAQVTGNGLPSPLTGTLTIANSAGVTLSANKTINTPGSCVVNSGALLTMGTTVISGTGTFTLASGGTLGIGSPVGITSSGATGNIQTTTRNFSTGANYTYNGSAAQVTGNGLPATVNNLTINNSLGVTLSGGVTVSDTLTLTSGNINASSYTLAIGASGSVSRTSGHVVGNLQKNVATGTSVSRTFEVGTASGYNPVTVAFGNVGTAGDLTIKATTGQHPNIGSSTINSSKDVNVYWSLTNSGIVFNNYNATFNFVSGDILGGANPANFIVGKYSSGWTYPAVGTKTATSTEATGITSFGDFAVGETTLTIEITAPDNIGGWALSPVETQPQEQTGTLGVTCNSAWQVTVKDADAATDGKMTDYYDSSYGTTQLANFLHVAAQTYEVTLPALPAGGIIATGSGDDPDVDVTFKQEVSWSDPVLPGGHSYRIIVTFTGTITS